MILHPLPFSNEHMKVSNIHSYQDSTPHEYYHSDQNSDAMSSKYINLLALISVFPLLSPIDR